MTDAAIVSRQPFESRSEGPTSSRAFAPFEWLIAFRYLRARRSKGFVSIIPLFCVLGIMLGVATLIVVMSVMNGFRQELFDKIIGVNGHAFIHGIDVPLTSYDDILASVVKVPGVKLAMPVVESPASVSTAYNQSGALVRGVRAQDLNRLNGISGHITQGSLEGFDASGGLTIGQGVAESMGVSIGDTITVGSTKGITTPFGNKPRTKSYPVTAIFKIGMSEYDRTFVYMPLSDAQVFFSKEGQASFIEVFVDNPDNMKTVTDQIQKVIGRPVIISDWTQRNKSFFDALNVERNVMFIILSMIIVVAVFNIISGLITLVMVKSNDIAILRTMGATRGAVMRIFLLAGAAIGLAGTLSGLGLGLLLANNVENMRTFLNWALKANFFPSELYFLSHLPAIIDPVDIVTVCATALGLAILATLYPSWRAAKLDPVEALRAA